MSKLMPVEFKNQRIMTTKVLADEFGTSEDNIKTNFNRNKQRFIEGKHYYKLEGQQLKEFKNSVTDSNLVGKNANSLTLWTEKGAARHAKILDTDEAWEVYEELEETYFRVKENKPTCIEDVLISSLQEMKALKGEVQAVKVGIQETKDKIEGIKDIVSLNSTDWKKDTASLISKIALKLGGFEHISDLRKESYNLLNKRTGIKLDVRLTNKRRRMADEGVCKSKRDKLNYIDVIAEDKKELEVYLAIVKEMAVKYGV